MLPHGQRWELNDVWYKRVHSRVDFPDGFVIFLSESRRRLTVQVQVQVMKFDKRDQM